MRFIFLGLFFWGLVAAPGAATATESGKAGFRLYSDFCFHEESGDVLGTRIGLLELEDGPYVMYQEAIGWPGRAQIVQVDRKDITRSKITFSIQDDGKSKTFRGSITAEQIIGRFDDNRTGVRGNTEFKLNRVTLPHKGFPDCR